MFYLTSKFNDNRVNTFGFMEGGAFETPLGPGTPKKPRRNGVKVDSDFRRISLTKKVNYKVFESFIYKCLFQTSSTPYCSVPSKAPVRP